MILPSVALFAFVAQAGHEKMEVLLLEIQKRVADDHFYLSNKKARAARESFGRLAGDAPALLRFEGHLKLGEEEQHVGNELEAIEHLEEAYRLLPEVEDEVAPEWISRLLFRLGMAYLRFGETQNCAIRHAAESCILPLRGSGIHVDQQPSRKAARILRELLEIAPPDSEPYRTGLWLLNLAYMTVGGYPDEVPPAYLVPPENFRSEEPFPVFPNVAMRARVATFTLSGSVVVEDFDADGFVDLMVSSYDPWEPVRLFLNREDGTFVEHTEAANLEGILGGLNMVQGDYDDDGDMDVLLLRGAWLGPGGRHPNSLLRNNGDGTFTDVTFETGLGDEHFPTQTASWADYDNDGDLDLYVGNETNDELVAPAQLFANQGNGRFADVAVRAGVENLRFAKAVVFGDYDADRFPDIYVSNLDDENRLYRNRGDGTFEDVAEALGVMAPRRSFPAWFWDFDNDSTLDIFVSAYEALVEDLTRFYLTKSYPRQKTHLYRGDGRGGFREMGQEAGLDEPSAPMGANFGDLDNDGFPDLYLGTGYPPYFALMPNVMYWNRDGKYFADVSASGFGHLQKGHGIAFLDFDNDGDQDVFEQMGGALAGDKFNDVLYQNPGFGNRWIKVTAVGVESNRAAIGARIRVDLAGRTIYKHVNSGGSFGANSLEHQMIGLGKAERIERLEIYWPTTDRTQTFAGVPLDRHIVVREDADVFWVVP